MTIPPNSGAIPIALCPEGSTLLGGGCRVTSESNGVTQVFGAPYRLSATQPGYECSWVSTFPADRTAQAEAICLTPAP